LGASFNSAASNFRLDGNANFLKTKLKKRKKKFVKSQRRKKTRKNKKQNCQYQQHQNTKSAFNTTATIFIKTDFFECC
jgi:hypothetical protein